MKIFVDGTQTIKEGDQTVTFTKQDVKVGQKVGIFSRLGEFFGTKPIAEGKVVSKCKDEAGAPVTPTKTGKRKRNAWRNLVRIKVTKIKE